MIHSGRGEVTSRPLARRARRRRAAARRRGVVGRRALGDGGPEGSAGPAASSARSWLSSGPSHGRAGAVRPVAAALPAADVLRAWDGRRAEAFAAGDLAALGRLYVPGSRAGTADRALLRGYLDRGLRVEGMRVQVLALDVPRSGQGAAAAGDRPARRRRRGGESVRSRAPGRGEHPRRRTPPGRCHGSARRSAGAVAGVGQVVIAEARRSLSVGCSKTKPSASRRAARAGPS